MRVTVTVAANECPGGIVQLLETYLPVSGLTLIPGGLRRDGDKLHLTFEGKWELKAIERLEVT